MIPNYWSHYVFTGINLWYKMADDSVYQRQQARVDPVILLTDVHLGKS